MAIDFDGEDLLSMEGTARWLESRTGRKWSRSTVYRWVSSGVGGVHLECCSVGGVLYTSVEAIRRFIDALSKVPAGAGSNHDRRRRREVEFELRRQFGER